MAQSVQGWRQKWFYIKDQKFSNSDQYGLAPFDVSKGLTKLTTWDALPSDAEVENIKPLLARIQELKNAAGNRLTGTQLMVFFSRDVFNRYRLEFPNYGLILARTILLECLLRTRRKRISIRGLDH
jgi:hypothetical protein